MLNLIAHYLESRLSTKISLKSHFKVINELIHMKYAFVINFQNEFESSNQYDENEGNYFKNGFINEKQHDR